MPNPDPHGKRGRFHVNKNTYGTVYFVEEIETLCIAGSFNSEFIIEAESRAKQLCEELNTYTRVRRGSAKGGNKNVQR